MCEEGGVGWEEERMNSQPWDGNVRDVCGKKGGGAGGSSGR